MTLIDNKTEPEKYVKLYSIESSKTTPKDLAFRDLPQLFNKYHVGKMLWISVVELESPHYF